MTDEQIKEITIALIEKGHLYMGNDNEEIAEEIARFINKLKEKVNSNTNSDFLERKNESVKIGSSEMEELIKKNIESLLYDPRYDKMKNDILNNANKKD